jgi:hypothetical protein
MSREYLPKAYKLYQAWRRWQRVWRFTNVAIGGSATLIGAVVAANAQSEFLPKEWSVSLAVSVPVLTFLLSALRPQVNATAVETAARELEKALIRYEADPTIDDAFLADRIVVGIDLLTKLGSS